PGGAGDEHVGQLGQVQQLRAARDVETEADGERGQRHRRLRARQYVAQGDETTLLVGHLDPDRLLARDGDDEADVRRGQRIRDVMGEVGDPVHLDTRCQGDLVAGHRGTGGDAGQGGVDTVLDEGLLQLTGGLVEHLAVDVAATPGLEQVERREPIAAGADRLWHRLGRGLGVLGGPWGGRLLLDDLPLWLLVPAPGDLDDRRRR